MSAALPFIRSVLADFYSNETGLMGFIHVDPTSQSIID